MADRLRAAHFGGALWLAAALLAAGCALFWVNLSARASGGLQPGTLLFPDRSNLDDVILHFGMLPRFVVALAAGAGLGLSGVLFQQVLRNPLAEPSTLGLFSGARITLALAMLWFPASLAFGMVPVAGAGCLAVLAIVLAIAMRQSFSPLFVILTGLVVSLTLEALASLLVLSHFEELGSLLVWQAGSLVQDNWHPAQVLCVGFAGAFSASLLLSRALTVLELEDAGARSLGLSTGRTRAAVLVLASIPVALVAAYVGIIGFIGLAGAALASQLGARRLQERLIAGPLIAAGLLLVTDQAVLAVSGILAVPAGTVTALLGAPLLLWLLRRIRSAPVAREDGTNAPVRSRLLSEPVWFAVAAAGLCVALALAIWVGRVPGGWQVASVSDLAGLLPWRMPRVMAAASAGAMLAMAGAFMQRMTGNGMASPELLGVSSGAALLLIPAVLFLPPLDRGATMLLAGAGAFCFLALALAISRKSGFAPNRLLLTGVALTALAGSLMSVAIFFGDVRVTRLLSWMSGSTYSVLSGDALALAAAVLLALALVPLLGRWLTILPLGDASARSLGVPVATARIILMAVTAALTGAATVTVGPLSFIGLMAPHIVRFTGLRGAVAQTFGAATTGAALLVLSDWIGRNLAFPWQIPAGQVATVIGGAYFMLLAVGLRRSGAPRATSKDRRHAG